MIESSFEEIVESSVMETLSKVLGENVWRSIKFYFDPKAISRDSNALTGALRKLFGNHSSVLERVIAESLFAKVGVSEENRRGSDFQSLFRVAKAKFISSTSLWTKPGASTI